MRVPYLNLTAEKLLRSLTAKELLRMVLNALLLFFFTLFFGGLTKELFSNLSEYWFFLFTTPAWILAFYFPIKAIRRHFAAVRAGENNAVFLKYGTPAEIADILSDPENEQVLDCKNVILTKAYFMKQGDYLTYIPLDDIQAIFVSRTFGRNPHVQIKVVPKMGEQQTFIVERRGLFLPVYKQMEMLRETIDAHMTRYAPQCTVEGLGSFVRQPFLS